MRLLNKFQALFAGRAYLHRDSSLGDSVAVEAYEDLYAFGHSAKLTASVDGGQRGTGPRNKAVTLQRMRRGDGTFGKFAIPAAAKFIEGYRVPRGSLATIDCAIEVKILNKAMVKQIDRVVGDLTKQVTNWRNVSSRITSLAIVGINHAEYTVGYEGDRAYRTDGRQHKHPAQEAGSAEEHIVERVVKPGIYDEVLVLRYKATNEGEFPFEWVNLHATIEAYSAILIRLSDRLEERLR